MNKTHLTFQDLYDYILTAERDSVGMHYLWGSEDGSKLPAYAFHIYEGWRQVNVCAKFTDDGQMTSIANFIFDVDMVSMIRVNDSGVADYDNSLEVPITTPIDTPRGAKERSPEVIRWTTHLGKRGGCIQEIFRDLLWPIVSK